MGNSNRKKGEGNPTECDRFCELLSCYLDNELSSDKCRELERHMKECDICRGFFESFELTIELSHKIGGCEEYKMPEEVGRRLREILRTRCKEC
ncbi:MAG: zf-HC2 domain-containing protein [Deltaproteobacteria bacterium]|nr:zf-HC2 domain-containing protein [Candidatus Zymogenaceae bacterium]